MVLFAQAKTPRLAYTAAGVSVYGMFISRAIRAPPPFGRGRAGEPVSTIVYSKTSIVESTTVLQLWVVPEVLQTSRKS